MYFTQDVNAVGCPHVVRMSFELPYLDWCRFQKSQLFHDLTEYLEKRFEETGNVLFLAVELNFYLGLRV